MDALIAVRTVMLRLIQAYLGYSYRRTLATATGVPRQQLWSYYGYRYGRTTTAATGILRLRLWANVQAYYINFFTAYTVGIRIAYELYMQKRRKVLRLSHSRFKLPILSPSFCLLSRFLANNGNGRLFLDKYFVHRQSVIQHL